MVVVMSSKPDQDLIGDWKYRIPDWDLTASGDCIEETESVLLLNGKPTGFDDVKDGPAVYIGRSNDHYDLPEHTLANPFPVADYSRKDSLLNYTTALTNAVRESEDMQDAVWDCYGRPLACWCLPKLCHGHVISWYLVYRLHAGMDPEKAGEQIRVRVQKEIDRRIKAGIADPADYY